MLVEKNKELEQIIYVSSHDLRTPLVNIQGFSYELSNICEKYKNQSLKNDYSKEVNSHLSYIKTNTEKIASLINGLLEFSRIGRDDFEFTKINMNDVVKSASKNFEQPENNFIKYNVNKLPYCYGDPGLLALVFEHLIQNSIQYSSDNRSCEITISGENKEKFSEYIFQDNGIGIKKSFQEKIFDIFHRLDPDIGEGVGIGLAIVNKIIKNHFGKIEVYSEPNEGTRFIISIPNSDPTQH